jgi:predicted dehydrogenase
LKIAIIGCGSIAAAHLAAIKKNHPGSRIYLMDTVRKAAESLASKWRVEGIYENLEVMLSEVNPDAVHVLTPPSTHFAIAKQALEAGCHVVVEKPVTETADEFIFLSQYARAENRLIAVDYSLLGMPVVQKAIREIKSGKLGRLISVHCNFACSWPGNKIPYQNPHHWAYDLKGGVLQNMADHPASLVLAIMDPIEEHRILFVRRNVLPNDCPDLLEVMVCNQDQVGSFTLSLAHGNAERRAYLLLEGGSIMIDMGRQLYFSTKGKGPQNFIKKTLSGFSEGLTLTFGTMKNILGVITGRLGRDPGVVHVIDNFYKAIKGEEELLIGNDSALAITKLLESIWNQTARSPIQIGSNSHESEADFLMLEGRQ